MKRQELEKIIFSDYKVIPDSPWIKYPEDKVFRHPENKKWFALVMTITKDKLGIKGNDKIDIVNFKCDPIMIGSLLRSEGIFPAYHMNKSNWVTVALDDSVPENTIKMLLQISYELTK